MTKARDIASATTPNANAALLATFPHRNLIINGAMQVAQRGTSFTPGNNSVTYTLDRWAYYSNNASSRAVTQEEEVVNGSLKKVLKASVVNPTTTSIRLIRQLIENLKQFSGKTLTISFLAKASVDVDFSLATRRVYGSGGSGYAEAVFDTITIGTGWTKFTSTFTVPDISGATFGTGNYLAIFFKTSELVSFDLFLTEVQLEFGSVATPFEHRSYGDELAACQRYYQTILNATPLYNYRQGSNSVAETFTYINEMRATPSFTLTRNSTIFGNVNTGAGTDGLGIFDASTTATALFVYQTTTNTTAAVKATVIGDAEL